MLRPNSLAICGSRWKATKIRGKRDLVGEQEAVNINILVGLSCDWVGVKRLFMCFIGPKVLMGRRKNSRPKQAHKHKKTP